MGVRRYSKHARWCIDCGVMLGLVNPTLKRCKACARERKNAKHRLEKKKITAERRKKAYPKYDPELSREQIVKKGADHWYDDIVNGFLDYHYGEERWDEYVKKEAD
ncbi:MAG: hypothetical protein KAS32_13850 [Candidatus Peribacteraceae bacterium]|nr:hypothetical protein [Candidatus Peribacteraceae bacterium]